MKKYKINKKMSKEMYLKHKDIVQFKGCFDNVYNIVQRERMLFSKAYEGYKICYGAWSVGDTNMYAKHCFFLKDDKVIDPTYYTTTESDKEYIVFKQLTPQEYSRLIVQLNGDVSLMKEMNKIQMELMAKGVLIIG